MQTPNLLMHDGGAMQCKGVCSDARPPPPNVALVPCMAIRTGSLASTCGALSSRRAPSQSPAARVRPLSAAFEPSRPPGRSSDPPLAAPPRRRHSPSPSHLRVRGRVVYCRCFLRRSSWTSGVSSTIGLRFGCAPTDVDIPVWSSPWWPTRWRFVVCAWFVCARDGGVFRYTGPSVSCPRMVPEPCVCGEAFLSSHMTLKMVTSSSETAAD